MHFITFQMSDIKGQETALVFQCIKFYYSYVYVYRIGKIGTNVQYTTQI